MSELLRIQSPIKGMNFSMPRYGMPTEYAVSIVNGICRNGAVVNRDGLAEVTGTDQVSLGNADALTWVHPFVNGQLQNLIGVTEGADVYKLTDTQSSIYSGSGTVTESNSVMFDGVMQYTLYPAAAPRTWDGYSDAALSFTRPATGDWSDPTALVTNGDFASGASWTTGAGWAIGAGTANATASSAGLTQTIAFSPGRSYTLTYTVSGFAAGTVTPRLTGGTTVTGTSRAANGTYTDTITAHSGGNTTLEFLGAGFTGSVDNVSVKIQGNLVDADVTGFCAHKSRVWYWSRKSDEACYTALLARGGTLVRFPLGYVAETGGNIVLIETLTMDGGNGPDDFLAFILDTGECLIYQGSDPASATDWALVGRFRVPPPLNGKCVTRIGGDSLMLTAAGLVPLQNYIKSSFGQSNVEWIEAINPELKRLSIEDGRLYHSSKKGLLLASVKYNPDLINNDWAGVLFVMDVRTGGWTYWKHGASVFDVSSMTLSPVTIDEFVAGICDSSDDLYLMLSDTRNSESSLLRYGNDSIVSMGVEWGFQPFTSRVHLQHARVLHETSGTGDFGVSFKFDLIQTSNAQFEQTFSNQAQMYTHDVIGECNAISPKILYSITTGDPDEGDIKLFGVEIEAQSAKGP